MTIGSVLARIAACRPALASDLASLMEEATDTHEVALASARSGAMVAMLDGRYVHSSVDPRREAQRLAHSVDPDGDHDGVVVLGVGLGYHIEELSRFLPVGTPIVAVSLSSRLLARALEVRGDEWWCSHGPARVCGTEPAAALLDLLESLAIRRPCVVTLPGEAGPLADRAALVGATLERYRNRTRVNRNTLRRFGRLWVRNTLQNARRYPGAPGLEDLAGAVSGLPALVVGAGPTLDDTLPSIGELARRCLVVAVDTAVAPLVRAGVMPDLAVVADPQYWNSRHLDRVDTAGHTQLVADIATHPRTLRLWRGPLRFSASLFPLGAFIDRHYGRTRRLGAGGSVATSAWDLARLVGCQRILLAGVDLGFPDSLTHCSGSFFEERLIRRGTRLATAEGGLHGYLHGASPQPVPAAGGGTVLSDERMQVYRSWFADQAITHPSVETILLSPRSSRIGDYAWWTAARAVTELAPIRRSTEPLLGLPRHDDAVRATRDAVARELVAALDRLRSVADAGIAICDGAPHDATLLRRLDSVDARLVALEEREILGFVAADALEQSASRRPETIAEAVEQARAMYGELRAAADYHDALLHRYSFSRDLPIL